MSKSNSSHRCVSTRSAQIEQVTLCQPFTVSVLVALAAGHRCYAAQQCWKPYLLHC